MEWKILKPRKALNKAFLKVKPGRKEIEVFKNHLLELLNRISEHESEEFHKNLITDFLKKTWYEPNHYINTKGRNDLVIHNGNKAKNTVGVIIETKKPTNKAEMLSPARINVKAFHELVLYYLRERITHQNLEVKHLIVTNIYEWYVFDARIFDRLFAQNKQFVKQFNDFEAGRLSEIKTDFFYKQIAEPFIHEINQEVEFTHFNLQDYEKLLRNTDKQDDRKLIALYKLLSPEHLLKLPFANDSNSLDKRFYSELLHIIGLTETKQGGKKLIERKPHGQRNEGSLLENAILQLDSLDKINRLDKPSQFGSNQQERLFNVGLELCISWINRILFLKLMEAQLLSYQKKDKSYAFLSFEKIPNYDALNKLFFQVLARKHEDRPESVNRIFQKVPYLNSSLFEPNELEHTTLLISNLEDDYTLPLHPATVLKDDHGKRRTGSMNTLQYLFEFLNAYDFSSEGPEEIQEENKSLINASVLGLIFEKINGYKDGSFFTPGFITMYMCRETLRRAVVQKFNETKGWNCQSIDELYDKIEDRHEANAIINSLKICDPAVGSGHFLVSALNEIIAIKNDLRILQDRQGSRLKEYVVEVVNDELVITDDDGQIFEYRPGSPESQRVQEALFHEKQTLIENCLFGVDINPNSVKICRLRLWIELLKNAYYVASVRTGHALVQQDPSQDALSTLETLPNIDINIKCGNSLVSRFALDADLGQALKKSKWTIDSYRMAVSTYRNAENKEQKREMERLIRDIKGDFRSEIAANDPKLKRLGKLKGELFTLTNQTALFEQTQKEKVQWNKKLKKLTDDIQKLETDIEEIKSNKIYENAFEWRFEFPEVLNENGDFLGFDVVIGNPPYIGGREWQLPKYEFNFYLNNFPSAEYQFDAYILFWDLASNISKDLICLITPNTWLNNQKNKALRVNLLRYNILEIADYSRIKVFEDATVLPIITLISKSYFNTGETLIVTPNKAGSKALTLTNKVKNNVWQKDDLKIFNIDLKIVDIEIRNKIEQMSEPLEKFGEIKFGIKLYETGKGIPPQSKNDSVQKIYESDIKIDSTYRMYLEGKDIDVFQIKWRNKWLKYGQNLAAPRDPSLFEGERLLVRRIVGQRLICAYTNEDYVTSQLLQIVKPFDSSKSKAILAVLNSKLMSYYFRKKYNRQDITFPEIRIYELSSLPILLPTDLSVLSENVDKIIDTKKQNPTADTTALELEIDRLVYALYGLTEEEIGIVEDASQARRA